MPGYESHREFHELAWSCRTMPVGHQVCGISECRPAQQGPIDVNLGLHSCGWERAPRKHAHRDLRGSVLGSALQRRLAVWLELLAEEVESVEADHQGGWQGAEGPHERVME